MSTTFILQRIRLHGSTYRPDSFVLMQSYWANSKAMRYESMNLNTIVVDKSHRVIDSAICLADSFEFH